METETLSETVTPINAATRALMSTSTEGLLDALVQLTHQVHAYTEQATDYRRHGMRQRASQAANRASELRAQRDMVRAELLRRAGA